jgi:tRNA(Ile)-lysidine synthase
MDIDLGPGVYIVAVSGGVDSVVLLDMLVNSIVRANNTGIELIVAHFDHGIRPDSAKDRMFVESLASNFQLRFVAGVGKLNPDASEELARNARYDFLRKVKKDNQASAIILAHHQNDLIETAIFNIIRGTGRRGLASLKSSKELIRPLLNTPKAKLVEYAKTKNLSWRDDSTNNDLKYTRNYIRSKITPRLDSKARESLLNIIAKQTKLNDEIDDILNHLLEVNLDDNQISRLWFATLEPRIGREVIASWLRRGGISSYDQNILNRLNTELRVAKVNSLVDATGGWQIKVNREHLALTPTER